MEYEYLDLLSDVLENGEKKIDRTGVGTLSVFGRTLRWHLGNGFPLITTKKVAWKPVVGELLWFIEGSNDERRLAEITYGTRDPARTTIWTANAQANYWKPKAEFDGDVGNIYGVQWRSWPSIKFPGRPQAVEHVDHDDGSTTYIGAKVNVKEIDQLANIIKSLKTNPADRRMVLTAFNVGEMDQMALPPCHMFAQFHVNQVDKELNCCVYIRSNDLFLGLPFNIASYALFVHMLAQSTGYEPGELIINIGDAHIYLNHLDQVKEQLSREPYAAPTLKLNPSITDIDDFKMEDIELIGYEAHPPIKGDMAV